MSIKTLLRRCALAAPILLAGCAGIPQTADSVPAASAPPFELSGRMVVRYQDRGFTSGVRWQHGLERDEIWLTAPLGQTIAYLRADAREAVLISADQKRYSASSVESLTRSALGWPLPLAALRYWVLARSTPALGVSAEERDRHGRLTRLEQDAWRVHYIYPEATSETPGAARLEAMSTDLEIRLVIDSLQPAGARP